jgi:hypothetical protein
VQGWPEGQISIKALGLGSKQAPGPVKAVQMLGVSKPLVYKQQDAMLMVQPPDNKPQAAGTGVVLKIKLG